MGNPAAPKRISISIQPHATKDSAGDVFAIVAIVDDGPELDLGVIYPDPVDTCWIAVYGEDCQNTGDEGTADGPVAAIGMMIDNALDDQGYRSFYPDEDDEEDDEEEEEDDDDEEEAEDGTGRPWALVAQGTWALEVHADGSVKGCLVRYDGDANDAMVWIPGVSILALATSTWSR